MFSINKIKRFLFLAGIVLVFLISSSAVLAADLGMNEAADIGLLAGATSDPRMLVANIVRFILGFLGIVATIIILYGGWLWMTSAGEVSRVEKAKKTLIAAVIGLIIIIAAFVIVSFVVGFIQDVINNSNNNGCSDPTPYSCPSGCSATPCGSITPASDSFRLRSTSPRADATNQPRNVAVRAFLSSPAAPSVDNVLDNNFTVVRTGDINPETGNFTDGADTAIVGIVSTSSNRSVLNFTPSANLDSWSRFQVTINGNSGIVDSEGRPLECGVLNAANCVFVFDTNDLIDVATPTVGIIQTQICHDDGTLAPDANIIGGWGRDDTGISYLRSYYNNPTTVIFDTPGTGARYQYDESQIDTSGMTVGSTHTFTVEVDDLVLNTEAASFEATVRTGHCCNGTQDVDEEEVDCGGADCDSCSSLNPIITNLLPDNGAPGNFITIIGRHFGTTQGQVYFSDASGNINVAASFPDPTNCPANWSNNQIIVVVPAGAASGPVRIVRADGREDTTAIDSAPQIDFIVNAIVRPGLCWANPSSAYYNNEFDLHGTSFGAANHYVRFGNGVDYITANNMHDWTNVFVSAQVPNISRGRTTVFVNANSEDSNFIYFNIQQDTANNPIIDYIDPAEGPNEQYITIYGSGFMSYLAGTSQVIFTNFSTNAETPAGIDFPEQCQNSWWHSRYIIVKVPAGVASGRYQVRVTNASANTSAPEDFNITNGSPTPGICALDPHNGPVGTAVNIYGDSLGATPGTVRFYNNVPVTPPNSDWAESLVTASVPAGAETGPVVVANGSNVSNSLPFTVGTCTSASDCEAGEDCCGSDSAWSGICRSTGTCAGTGFAPTGFGWNFSTAITAGPGESCSDGATCNGAYPGCADPTNYFCDPDSGCTCQPRSDTTDSCEGRSLRTNSCDPLVCPNSPGTCSPFTATGYQVLDGIACDDSCAGVANCTTGTCDFVEALDTCVLTDRFCTQIEYDLFGREVTATCEAYGSAGEYYWQISTSASCPTGWVNIGNNRCADLTVTCEPCPSNFRCQDYDSNGQGDCVSRQRMCTGTSRCVGTECRVADENSCECCCRLGYDAQDCCTPLTCEGNCGSDASGTDTDTYGYCSGCAAASDPDAACNCAGHEGKFCDSTTNAAGICRDCAALDSTECANHEACCVDARNGNRCRGIGVDGQRDADGTCSYFSCEISGTDANCVASDSGAFKTTAECEGQCFGATDIPIGERCQNLSPVYNCTTGLTSCGVYNCASNDAGTDCRCCCDPNNDTCPNGLNCLPNEPCDSPAGNRGLCCGCTSNNQCYGGSFQGCGSDTCCHERPQVSETLPLNEEEGVCRNALIEAHFDQSMRTSGFTGNFILLGDYGDSVCPAGTSYLALETIHHSKLAQFVDKIKSIFHKILAVVWTQQPALAQFNPTPGHTYCAVGGTATGYNDTSDIGAIQFKINSPLDANIVYFAIVLGDRNLDNLQGVLSNWGIGMNDATYDASPEMATFNGIFYGNSYIWAFRTGEDICELSSVTIDPASYLFTQPNDTATFFAESRAANGQEIVSIPGVYEWTWNWNSSKSSVATVSNDGEPDPIQTVTSQNVQDDRTVVSATASIVNQNRFVTGRSNVYVFLCENPWPVRASDGSWEPWHDQAGNCIPGSGECANSYNYELYYCRDKGRTGTFDDLPPLLGTDANPPIIRGRSSTTLKEVYFFREDVPTATTSLSIVDDGTGDTVTASWAGVPEPSLTNYRLYWGTSSGNYSNYRELPAATNNYQVVGLTPRNNYYFRLTAIYSDNRVETDLYNEVIVAPEDTTAPDVPLNLLVETVASGQVRISWDAVGGAVDYRVHYGTTAGVFGSSQNTGNVTTVILTGLTPSNSYYFSVTAIDAAGNESSSTATSFGPISPNP